MPLQMVRTSTGKENRDADLSPRVEEASCYFCPRDEGEMRT